MLLASCKQEYSLFLPRITVCNTGHIPCSGATTLIWILDLDVRLNFEELSTDSIDNHTSYDGDGKNAHILWWRWLWNSHESLGKSKPNDRTSLHTSVSIPKLLALVGLFAFTAWFSFDLSVSDTLFPSSISIPKRTLWTMWLMSGLSGCCLAEWVETWKFPGTYTAKRNITTKIKAWILGQMPFSRTGQSCFNILQLYRFNVL